MNDNPTGAPNPFNKTTNSGGLNANPAEPNMTTPRSVSGFSRPTSMRARQSMQYAQNPTMGMNTSMGNQATPPVNNVHVDSLDPTGRKMEQVPNFANVQPPKKKKKTGLIIGVIVGILVICGGVVAALWYFGLDDYNPVEKAVAKVLKGENPTYADLNGSILLTPTIEELENTKITITFQSNLNASNLENNSSITATMTYEDDSELTVNIDEIYTSDGDLYLRADNLVNAAKSILDGEIGDDEDDEDVAESDASSEDAADTESSSTDSNPLAEITTILDGVDGVWLKISADDLSTLTSSTIKYNDIVSCTTSLISNRADSSEMLLTKYDENRFIDVTTENLSVSSKNSTIYKISLDNTTLSNYANSIRDTDFAYDLYSCLGTSNTQEIDVSGITNLFDEGTLALYAEVDADYNFSRIYAEYDWEDFETNIKADLNISYPDNITVTAPNEENENIEDFNTVFTSLMGAFYSSNILTINGYGDECLEDDDCVIIEE